MNGVENQGCFRQGAVLAFWFWVIAIIGLYVQTFEGVIRLMFLTIFS